MKRLNNEKAAALAEFVFVIVTLIMILLCIVQFSIIYAAKLVVKYAAYTACRVGIVNYTEDGTFEIDKIRHAALRCLSPIAKAGTESGKSLFGPGRDDAEARMKNAGILLEVEAPEAGTEFNIQNVRKPGKSPCLTVKLIYKYRPAVTFLRKLFYEEPGGFIELKGEATMPVEIGGPFTPTGGEIYEKQ